MNTTPGSFRRYFVPPLQLSNCYVSAHILKKQQLLTPRFRKALPNYRHGLYLVRRMHRYEFPQQLHTPHRLQLFTLAIFAKLRHPRKQRHDNTLYHCPYLNLPTSLVYSGYYFAQPFLSLLPSEHPHQERKCVGGAPQREMMRAASARARASSSRMISSEPL